MCPLAPFPATSSISSDIGLFSLIIEPATCTVAAPAAAVFAAATIWSGDFEATPLPEEEELPPQPASSAAARSSPSTGRAGEQSRGSIAAETLAGHPVGVASLIPRGRRAVTA